MTPTLEHRTLMALDGFAALSAIWGGLAILVGWIQFPMEWLRASPFTDYTVPALVLFIVVGGSALLAALAEWRLSVLRAWISAGAGVIMMGWIVVEIAIIQQFSWLHAMYFALGFAMTLVALRELSPESGHEEALGSNDV